MAKRRLPPGWRRVFLRALARTGNVRAAAAEARVDPGTAYDHRAKDAAFAGRWAAAREKAARVAGGAAERAGPGLVARRSGRGGVQLVQAGAGRWSAKAEAAFLAELARTGCVRRAAAACGFSTTALYGRRRNHPDFATRWAAAENGAKARLYGLLIGAGIAAFDPEPVDDDAAEGARPVSVAEAIAILRLKGAPGPSANFEGADGAGAGAEPPIEAVRDEVLRRLEAMRRHRDG